MLSTWRSLTWKGCSTITLLITYTNCIKCCMLKHVQLSFGFVQDPHICTNLSLDIQPVSGILVWLELYCYLLVLREKEKYSNRKIFWEYGSFRMWNKSARQKPLQLLNHILLASLAVESKNLFAHWMSRGFFCVDYSFLEFNLFSISHLFKRDRKKSLEWPELRLFIKVNRMSSKFCQVWLLRNSPNKTILKMFSRLCPNVCQNMGKNPVLFFFRKN